jgi:hypothetical protein
MVIGSCQLVPIKETKVKYKQNTVRAIIKNVNKKVVKSKAPL